MLLMSVRMHTGARKAEGGGGANVSVDFGLLREGMPRRVGSATDCPPHVAGSLSALMEDFDLTSVYPPAEEEERTVGLVMELPRPRPRGRLPRPRPGDCRGEVVLVRARSPSESAGSWSWRRRALYAGMGSGPNISRTRPLPKLTDSPQKRPVGRFPSGINRNSVSPGEYVAAGGVVICSRCTQIILTRSSELSWESAASIFIISRTSCPRGQCSIRRD